MIYIVDMLAREYVEAFEGQIAYEERLAEPWRLSELDEQSQGWSYLFGKLLHDELSGLPSETFSTPEVVARYRNWNINSFGSRTDVFNTLKTDEPKCRTATFHSLNSSSLPLWGVMSPHMHTQGLTHQRLLRAAQESLAVEGVLFMAAREEYISNEGGTHRLFKQRQGSDGRWVNDGGFEGVVGDAIGVMNEFDVAIVALEALLRHPRQLGADTVVLPSPMQFEERNPAVNADHIVYSRSQDRAIGIQSKMTVTDSHVRQIDPRRVVLVDGRTDFSSVRPVRVEKASSKERVVAWPGIIAAKIASELDIRTSPLVDAVTGRHGNLAHVKGHRLPDKSGMVVHRMQALERFRYIKSKARGLLGDFRVNMPALSKIVADRIAAKL